MPSFCVSLDMLLFFDPHFSGKFEHHENLDEELPATMVRRKQLLGKLVGESSHCVQAAQLGTLSGCNRDSSSQTYSINSPPLRAICADAIIKFAM